MARPSLDTHRKFLKLARVLSSKVLARGVLETLWAPCYEAGDAYLGTADDIEAICEWKGTKGALTTALLDAGAPKGAGFIEPYEGDVRDKRQPHYQVHDLFPNAPRYVINRRDRERERNTPKVCERCGEAYFGPETSRYCSQTCRTGAYRTRRRTQNSGEAVENTDAVCTPVSTVCTPVYTTPAPAPVQDVRTHEDVRTTSNAVLGCTAVGVVAARDAATPTSPALHVELEEGEVARRHQRLQKRRHADPRPDDSLIRLTFPVVGEGGPWWHLREAQIEAWHALYPDLDILGEARHALAWVEADATRRKTFGGMLKYLVNWFNRSVDSTRARGRAPMTGSLKTAGNLDALQRFVDRGRK